MKVKATPIRTTAGTYILINSNDGDVLHAPNKWKTQRGAERWAQKNGFSVAKPAAKPSAKPKAKSPAKPKAKSPAKPKAKPSIKAAVQKPKAPKKTPSRLPKSVGSVEKNAYGAYVIHGDIGTRRYMGYTKREALARYNAEAKGRKK